jgi:hypothetical protein
MLVHPTGERALETPRGRDDRIRWAAIQDEQTDLIETVVTHVEPDSD